MATYPQPNENTKQGATNRFTADLEEVRAILRAAAAWLDSQLRSPRFGAERNKALGQALNEYDAAFAALERALKAFEEGSRNG